MAPPGAVQLRLGVRLTFVAPSAGEASAGAPGRVTAALIVNVWPLEAPPPGAGFTTVTVAVPGAATLPAGTAAVSCVALTKLVLRLMPFHCTVEEEIKLLPFTVSVNAAPPAVALAGLTLVVVGAGLLATSKTMSSTYSGGCAAPSPSWIAKPLIVFPTPFRSASGIRYCCQLPAGSAPP